MRETTPALPSQDGEVAEGERPQIRTIEGTELTGKRIKNSVPLA